MLQEDVAGESLHVLRQIAQQTATYQLLLSDVLNTTATLSPPSAPFQPFAGALRVNILWFTSLVFSLFTASIGILVKQWLRAYTTYKTSSAQDRMRVRHFHRQGLETWKVYEIAAMLPLLIQLALGLFFIGLCYFTAEVHPDLRRATLPLVDGWALFIFVVTILPLVSSHCSYKPASFEGLYANVRRRLFSLLATSKFHSGFALWATKRTTHCAGAHRPYDEADAVKYTHKDSIYRCSAIGRRITRDRDSGSSETESAESQANCFLCTGRFAVSYSAERTIGRQSDPAGLPFSHFAS